MNVSIKYFESIVKDLSYGKEVSVDTDRGMIRYRKFIIMYWVGSNYYVFMPRLANEPSTSIEVFLIDHDQIVKEISSRMDDVDDIHTFGAGFTIYRRTRITKLHWIINIVKKAVKWMK